MSTPASISVPSAPSLAADWIEKIDLRAFDHDLFFKTFGVTPAPDGGVSGELRATFETFQPRPDHPSPLDVRQFDQAAVRQFMDDVMATISEGEDAASAFLDHTRNEPVDRAFAQTLFNRWFLQLAAPANGNDENTRVSPFDRELLALTHPDRPDRISCAGGRDALTTVSLPRIDTLKKTLQQEYLNSYASLDAGLDAGLARVWAFEGLCEIFEPALLRRDLPETFRYGSLAWALLSIGIDLAGDAHNGMSSHELISLGATADLFSDKAADMGDAGIAILRNRAIPTILRMAHAQGAINLRGPGGQQDVTRRDIETGINLFASQLAVETSKSAPLARIIASIRTRSQVAKEMLRFAGIYDPEKIIDMRRERNFDLYAPTKNGVRLRKYKPKPEPIPETLLNIFMSGRIPGMLSRLSAHDRNLVSMPGLTYDDLNVRFESEFTGKIRALTREILVPALSEQIALMSAEDEQFWRCGVSTVRIPAAMIRTHRNHGLRHTGGVGAGSASDPIIRYKAQDNVLVRLTREIAGATQTRTYSVSLKPVVIERYNVDDKAYLAKNLHRFFKPEQAGEKLLDLAFQASLAYEDSGVENSGGDLLHTVSERLMQHSVIALRKTALETTDSETFRTAMQEMVLDLIPLRACILAVQAGDTDHAALHCTMDAFSLLPVAAAGLKSTRAVLKVGAAMTRPQAASIAKVFLTRSVQRHVASQAAGPLLSIGKPAIKLAALGAGLWDPGVGLALGGMRAVARAGVGGLSILLTKIAGIPRLAAISEQIKSAQQLLAKVYPDGGFWRARPEAVVTNDGRRQVAIGDKFYDIHAIGETGNVVAIPDGDDFRLLNPQSNAAYGPLLQRGATPGRLELATGIKAYPDGPAGGTVRSRYFISGTRPEKLCRVKRAPTLPAGCGLVADQRFGVNGYVMENLAPSHSYQFRLTDADIARSQFDIPATGDLPGGERRIRLVNLRDRGYETTRKSAEGVLEHVTPGMHAHPIQRRGKLGSAVESRAFPPSRGTIVHLEQVNSATGADFIKFEIEKIDDSGATVRTVRHVPFATYQELDGTVIGIAYLDASTARSFSVSPLTIPLRGKDLDIVLKPASVEQLDKNRRFQIALKSGIEPDPPEMNSISRLVDAPEAVQARFKLIFDRSEEILDSAIAAMENHHLAVARICAKLLGTQPDDKKLYVLLNAMWKNLSTMQGRFPYLKSQLSSTVGLFESTQDRASGMLMGMAVPRLGDLDISFRHIPAPLVVFNSRQFMNKRERVDSLATAVLHEYSHFLFDTADTMNPGAARSVYAGGDRKKVILTTIKNAAALLGSEPERHADTFAHAAIMMAYLIEPGTLDLIKPYLTFSEGYTLAKMEADVKGISCGLGALRRADCSIV